MKSVMKVIILGSTGMVGKAVLLECLDDDRITGVLVINRRPIGVKHPKLEEIILQGLDDLSSLRSRLSGLDACFFCVGVTVAGKDEATYSSLTYDLTVNFAKEVLAQAPNAVFIYVSGAGTDSSGQGSVMWARVKGRTENTLLSMGFKASYMFRPGYIQPLRGVKSTIGWYNTFYAILKPFYFLLRSVKSKVTDSVTLARAMIHVALEGYEKNILESTDINKIGDYKA